MRYRKSASIGSPAGAGRSQVQVLHPNAPHSFHNATNQTGRLLCMVAPSGLEEFFAEVGDPVPSRTSPAPALDEASAAARMPNAQGLAARYRVDTLPPQ